MNMALATKDFSDLQDKINKIIPPGTSPIDIFKDVVEKYPKNKEHLEKINSFKNDYDNRSFIGKWWDNDKLRDKTTEATFLLTEMSDSQLKLQILTCWMCNELKKQQDIIHSQQRDLSRQSEELNNNHKSMKIQQEFINDQSVKLEEQNREIRKHQVRLQKDNEDLIMKADVLRKLRELGMKHHADIDKHNRSLTGMEQLLMELEQHVVNTVLKEDYEIFKTSIEDSFKSIEFSVKNINMDIDRKIEAYFVDAIVALKNVKWS